MTNPTSGLAACWSIITRNAWAHEDGDGFNLQLVAIPLTGRLVVRKPKPQGEEDGR